MIALTGTAMEYLTPLSARTHSFKEFMEEWVADQFMKNLAEFELDRPWFWDLFIEELDYAHHSVQLGFYAYRTTLWFDVAAPDEAEREWLNQKYGDWGETFGPLWDQVEARWESDGEAGTLAQALPALCNLCQLPTVFVRPGRSHRVHARGRRSQLPLLLRAVPLDLHERDAAVRGTQERRRPDRARGGAGEAHRPARVDGPPRAHRDRQGPAARPGSLAARADPHRWRPVVIVYLFGYLSDDFFGRVIVGPNDRTVAQLAAELTAWGSTPGRSGPATVVNEAGDQLETGLTIAEAGLGNGDIFTVVRDA